MENGIKGQDAELEFAVMEERGQWRDMEAGWVTLAAVFWQFFGSSVLLSRFGNHSILPFGLSLILLYLSYSKDTWLA